MGLLRFYLALCVVAGHSGMFFPWTVHSASEAVQIFYVISGFYMALIASKYASIPEFYASRFLRIFVPYWMVLGIILVVSTLSGWTCGKWMGLQPYISYTPNQNGLLGVVLTGLSNISLFSQDWVLFFKHDPGQSLAFTADFWRDSHPLWHYLLVPQAWSVGIELSFYLFAPVLTSLASKQIMMIIAASLLSRAIAYTCFGLGHDPWTYRFFPFEIALFLFGILGFRVYRRLGRSLRFDALRIADPKQYALFSVFLTGLLFAVKTGTIFLGGIVGDNWATLLSDMIWIGAMPLLFSISRHSRLDRYIGELSFPMYLVHMGMISVIGRITEGMALPDGWLGSMCAMGSIGCAVFLMKYLITPLEARRQELAASVVSRFKRPIPVPVNEVE